METIEEAVKRRIMIAEIKENVWKRRGPMSSHEEHSSRMEQDTEKVERGKVKDRIKNLENLKRSAQEKEAKRRRDFMATWKEKENRKRRKAKLEKGWKELMESVATWDELQEEEVQK